MVDRGHMDEFFEGGCWAVLGVSRDPEKFGSIVHRRLRDRGETVFAINPQVSEIEGDPCYPSLDEVPETVEQIVVVLPPGRTVEVVREAVGRGVRRVWMQPGAESKEAVEYCETHGVNVVSGHCILRYMDGLDFRKTRSAKT